LIPIVALTLIATVQNINPRFSEVAQSLGASRAQAMLTVVVPLSMRGVMSVFVLCYSLSLSAFVIPMVLGKGYVLFVTNLIYSRFSEVSDWPGGAALSITMLALSLLVVYGLMRLTQRRFDHA
jgi:ABC-type spermidine/putrescine transport system permease subunit I